MNRRMKTGTAALAVAIAGGLALAGTPAANAGTFQGTTYGEVGIPTATTTGTGGIDWYNFSTTPGYVHPNQVTFGEDANPQNGNQLTFYGLNGTSGHPSFDTDAGDPFAVGNLEYYNGLTHTGTRNIPLDVTLHFDAPPSTLDQEFSFSFDLAVTYGATPDTLTANVPSTSIAFNANGADYLIKLLGFSADGGTTFTNSFVLGENGSTTPIPSLFAQITAVPTPAALPLGLGLMSFLGLRRRKRQMA